MTIFTTVLISRSRKVALLGATVLSQLLTLVFIPPPAIAKDYYRHKYDNHCKRVPNRRIGVQLWTLRELMDNDVAGTLEAVADAGYRNVEPFSFHGHTAEEFAKLLHDNGLRAPSMHTNIDALSSNVDQVLADAHTIGARYVTLGWVAPEWRTEEGVAELTDILNHAGMAMKREGLQLVYHNHDFEFLTTFGDGRTMYETLADSTHPRLVKFQLDLYWVVAGGIEPVDVIYRYRKRIVTLHVKDRDEDGFFADVGEGLINFAEIFDTRKFRYYIVENDEPDDPIESIKDSYYNLRQICY